MRPVVAVQMDGRTDMTKVIAAFHNFPNSPTMEVATLCTGICRPRFMSCHNEQKLHYPQYQTKYSAKPMHHSTSLELTVSETISNSPPLTTRL